MKATAYLTPLLPALVLAGCATQASPLQEISDARSAVAYAAMQMADCHCDDDVLTLPYCSCDLLQEAQAEVTKAEVLLGNGDREAAYKAAHSALNRSQNLLRELHHGAKN